MTIDELLAAVDGRFRVLAESWVPWPDPHEHHPPLEEEYSRTSDPTKWRIIGVRAEAWIDVLVESGLAEVERNAAVGGTRRSAHVDALFGGGRPGSSGC